jgi:hypothetical protein
MTAAVRKSIEAAAWHPRNGSEGQRNMVRDRMPADAAECHQYNALISKLYPDFYLK